MTEIGRSAPIAVIGAGTMGTGIVQVAAVAGHPVTVYDTVEGAAGGAVAAVQDRVARLVARGRLDCDPGRLRLRAATELGELAHAECVIEAVAEDLAVKQALFADLEVFVSPGCVLATNTSSLSPTAIAAGLSHPGRLAPDRRRRRGPEGEAMTLTWTKENSPRWDADKQRILGPAELAAVGLAEPVPGEPVADEWWRVTDGEEVAGYGWLDSEWGDARITFVVAPGRRGGGVGAFILEHLEDEAAARGLNYIYNVVPDTHPDGAWIRNWLSTHGFHEASRGQLRRQVVMPAGSQ